MKRILFLLFTALALNLSVVAQDDSTRITEWEDTVETVDTASADHTENKGRSVRFGIFGEENVMGSTVAIVAVVFGFPVLIVFIAFYFQYRNRRERYRLAEKALEAGQPIPEEFIKIKGESNTLSKGIKNIFLGLGLFIFLWAMTDFSIGTIGLLIMFTGFAQVIIHYVNNGNKDK